MKTPSRSAAKKRAAQAAPVPPARGRAISAPVGLVATTMVAALTLFALGRWAATTGLWCDELLFLHAVRLGPLGGLMAEGSSHPPLLRLLVAPLAFGSAPDLLLRAPSLLCAAGTVILWSLLLARYVEDDLTALILLPAIALNAAWLSFAYQLVPYSLFAFCAALHAWSWFGLLDKGDLPRRVLFVVSAAACAWSHFLGFAVLFADQVVWTLLAWLRAAPSVSRKTWLATSLATWLLAAPMIPLLTFYARSEGAARVVLPPEEFAAWFRHASETIFESSTLYRMDVPGWTVLLLYAALAVILWSARRGAAGTDPKHGFEPRRNAAIMCGIFLCGLPAIQLYGLATRAPIFERYVVPGAWIHIPLLVLAVQRLLGVHPARLAAVLFVCLGLTRTLQGSSALPYKTIDYAPVVAAIHRQARDGDAFWAQDMDMWVGEKNFDRSWFERYVPFPIPVLSGPQQSRDTMYAQGLAFDRAPASVRRIWVFSHLFPRSWLLRMPSGDARGWNLESITPFEQDYELALFARTQDAH